MSNRLERLKQYSSSTQMLRMWRKIPNPDHQFFIQHGVSPHKALKNLSYSPEIQSVILARESAIIGDSWEIIGDNDDETIFVKDMLEKIGINSIFREILNALWYGYAIIQHPIIKSNNKYSYQQINTLPHEWFAFNENGLLIPNNQQDTTPMNTNIGDTAKEVELVQYRSSYDNPYGESLLARVFWSATWIRGTMDLWISYIDRFGDDSIIGRVEMSNEERKLSMLHAIQEFRSSGAMVIEGSDSIDILKADKSNSSQLFNEFYEVCTKQINKIFLGHSSSLDSTPGKLGNELSIDIVRQDILQNDKALIAETINRLIQHISILNNFASVKFLWQAEPNIELARISRDHKLQQMGIEFSKEYLKKTYGLQDTDIANP